MSQSTNWHGCRWWHRSGECPYIGDPELDGQCWRAAEGFYLPFLCEYRRHTEYRHRAAGNADSCANEGSSDEG
jgi:hypothetical protein